MNAATTVRQIMTRKVFTLKPDMDIYGAVHLLLKKRISGAPVIDADKALVGILSEKDCLRMFLGGAYSNTPGGVVSQYMTTDVQSCSPDDDLFKISDYFFRHSFRRLPVVEDNTLVGLVSRCDILKGSIDLWKQTSSEIPLDDSRYLSPELQATLKDKNPVKPNDIRVDGMS